MNEPLATPQQATSVARGEAFRTTDGAFLSSDGIIQHFSTARSEQDYLQRAAELNGSWYYISNSQPTPSHDIFAFVDHRSTLSLYYRIEGSAIRFSDNGFDLIRRGPNRDAPLYPSLLLAMGIHTRREHTAPRY